MKADNETGLKFYERNGFVKLRYLRDYYIIDGQSHCAFLYIYYVNGAAPPVGWIDYIIKRYVHYIMKSYELIDSFVFLDLFGPSYHSLLRDGKYCFLRPIIGGGSHR